jgi:hypothetical protein
MKDEVRLRIERAGARIKKERNHEAPGAAEPQAKYLTQRRKGAKKNLEPQMNADERRF